MHIDETRLLTLFDSHDTNRDGSLTMHELAGILAELGDEEAHTSAVREGPAVEARSVSGPSTQVQPAQPPAAQPPAAQPPAAQPPAAAIPSTSEAAGAPAVVEPEELCLALAAYCERERLGAGEVVLHLYPFGGVESGLRMLQRMADGVWPVVQ